MITPAEFPTPIAPEVVIWNPRSGKRRGVRRIAPLQSELAGRAEFWPTDRPGHARELALRAVEQGAACVLAAGGDGTVHEVANGLLESGNRSARLGVAPIGSANDFAFSLTQELRELGYPRLAPLEVDVGIVRGTGGKQKYFIESLGLGLNGLVTLEAQQIRWLQGFPLYGLATLKALWRQGKAAEMCIQWNQGIPVVGPTLLFCVLLGRREGNFPLAPTAKLGDGWFNFVHVSIQSTWEVLRLFPQVAIWGPPTSHRNVRQGLCQQVRVLAPQPLTVHTDGEMFCQSNDGVYELEIELIPRRLCVQLWEPNAAADLPRTS